MTSVISLYHLPDQTTTLQTVQHCVTGSIIHTHARARAHTQSNHCITYNKYNLQGTNYKLSVYIFSPKPQHCTNCTALYHRQHYSQSHTHTQSTTYHQITALHITNTTCKAVTTNYQSIPSPRPNHSTVSQTELFTKSHTHSTTYNQITALQLHITLKPARC